MRQQAPGYLSAHGQTTSRSQIPHREAFRRHSTPLPDSEPSSSNATSSHVSPPPEPSVASRTGHRRRTDILRSDEQFGYIMSTKTKLIHSQRTRSTQGGFQQLTMSLPCQHLSNLPVADLLFSSPCMSSDLIELDPFSGAKEIP